MKRFEHIVSCFAVLIWGFILMSFYKSDVIAQYIDEKFHLYVLIGGLAAVVLGLFNLLTSRADVEDCCSGDDHDHSDHDHSHGSDMHPLVSLLLLIGPLVLAINYSQHEFTEKHKLALSDKDVDAGTFHFADIPPFTIETLKNTRSKSEDGAFQLNLMELFFSAGDEAQEKIMDGLYVETEGKLRSEPNRNESGKRMRLYRLFMVCCAADTKAVPMSIEFAGPLSDITPNSWVRVAGVMSYERIEGVVYPVLKVKTIREIPVPEGEWSEGLDK